MFPMSYWLRTDVEQIRKWRMDCWDLLAGFSAGGFVVQS